MKLKIKSVIITVAVIFLIVLFAIIETNGYFTSDDKKIVNIEKGQGFSQIVTLLHEKDVVNYKFGFKLYAKLFYNDELYKIDSGELVFNGKLSYKKVMELLISDKRTRDDIAVTIPEGYELREIADILEEKGLINRKKFYDAIENYDFGYSYLKDIPKSENRLEGFLFPDTYMFSKTIDDEVSIIKKMLKRFDEVYSKYLKDAQKYSYSTYEIITLASIIEREGGSSRDFYTVSSVFHNRLKRNDNLSYLQSCATVQYILKERKKVLTISDTKIDSPYNTYKYPYLPKGPISSPGEEAIKAALNPEKTDYLYFLNDKDGKLHFSRSLSEHESKKNKYVN